MPADHLLFTLLARMDAISPPTMHHQQTGKHSSRTKDGLNLVETTLREERERGRPFDAEMAKKLEGYARFGLKNPPRA
jgi:hypothetical protein